MQDVLADIKTESACQLFLRYQSGSVSSYCPLLRTDLTDLTESNGNQNEVSERYSCRGPKERPLIKTPLPLGFAVEMK